MAMSLFTVNSKPNLWAGSGWTKPEAMLSEVSVCFEQKLSHRSPDQRSLTGGDAACTSPLLRSHAVPLVMTVPATAGTEKQKLLAQMEQHQHPRNLSQILVSKCP